MIQQLSAIAVNGFREARRNRITSVIIAFALVLILSSTVAIEFTVTTFERVMTDLGLGVMALISAGLTVFLGSGLIPREIERRTIFMVVSRPVSRSAFFVGRLLGNLLTVYLLLIIMTVLLVVQFQLAHFELSPAVYVAVVGLLAEATLLASIAVFFSSWSSQLVTVVATLGLFFMGHASGEIFRMAEHSQNPLTRSMMRVLFYVVPNLDRVDWKGQATYGEIVPMGDIVSSCVYVLGYSVVLVAAACVVFERRDFK